MYNVDAPGDRPKFVRNSCVIERTCTVLVSIHLGIVCRLGVLDRREVDVTKGMDRIRHSIHKLVVLSHCSRHSPG